MSGDEIAALERIALDVITRVLGVVSDAREGKVSHEDAKNALQQAGALPDELAADRAAGDKALDDKFPE